MSDFPQHSVVSQTRRGAVVSDDARVLVVGATGELGGAVARRLLAAGVPGRAFGRNRAKLDALVALGAESVAGDLRDREAVEAACDGVGQLFTSANNVMGSGDASPNRVDLPAYRTVCEAATRRGVRRLVHVSGRGMGGATSPVDFFRVKHQVDEVVQRCGVPHVILRPTAFLETWAALLLGAGIRDKGVAVLFGDGQRVSNFIAIDDVADFALSILQREEVRDEIIDVGGPSNVSFLEVVSLVERELGVTAKRRHIPVAVLRLGAVLLRPINEVAARKMALGYFSATCDGAFADWRKPAERFGVSPMTAERFIARWNGRPNG